MRKLNVAVVGATGAVGESLLNILSERSFPINTLYPLASNRSTDQTVFFNGNRLDVLDLDLFDFTGVDIAFFSAGASVSDKYVPFAVAAGCVVIDNTSRFRYEDDVPLVIPEVNPEKIADYTKRYIIANPNCSTIQMLVALKPLHDAVGLHKINVATYQAVSGTGRRAITELINQVGALLNGKPIKPEVYLQQIAFNVLPHIDEFQDNGYTKEEMKMVWETQKIMNDSNILVNPTAVRVPVLYGHSEALHVEFKQPITPKEAQKLLSKAPGVKVVDSPKRINTLQHLRMPQRMMKYLLGVYGKIFQIRAA